MCFYQVTPNEQLHLHSAEFRYSGYIRSDERFYTCDVCNKAFSYRSRLIKYQRLHNGEHPYTCDVCKKTFSQKSTPITHERIYCDKRPYICDVCIKAFSHQSNFIKHKRIHNYACEIFKKEIGKK